MRAARYSALCAVPGSFKLNGRIESANDTHKQELWECCDPDLELPELHQALLEWEREYNEV